MNEPVSRKTLSVGRENPQGPPIMSSPLYCRVLKWWALTMHVLGSAGSKASRPATLGSVIRICERRETECGGQCGRGRTAKSLFYQHNEGCSL